MGTSLSPANLAAMAASHVGGESALLIPKAKLGEVVEIPLGFQPLGITSRVLPDGRSQLAMANYFGPGVVLATITDDDEGLHLVVDWIDSVRHGIETVRFFPDILWGGANRMQTVNFDSAGNLWVSRNEGRAFYVCAPPSGDAKLWTLVRRVELPKLPRNHGGDCVHAALLQNDYYLLTVEADAAASNCNVCHYVRKGKSFCYACLTPTCSSFVYGLAFHPTIPSEFPLLITDPRSNREMKGVFRADTDYGPRTYLRHLITGNGLTFLPSGAAFVTQYNHRRGTLGAPGKLIYLPPGAIA